MALDFFDDWVEAAELVELFGASGIGALGFLDAFGWEAKFVKQNL